MKWLKRICRKIFNKKSEIPKYVDRGNGYIRLEGHLRPDCKSIIYVNHTETIHLTAIRKEAGDCTGCVFRSDHDMCLFRVRIEKGFLVRPCVPIGNVTEFYKLVRPSDLLEEL